MAKKAKELTANERRSIAQKKRWKKIKKKEKELSPIEKKVLARANELEKNNGNINLGSAMNAEVHSVNIEQNELEYLRDRVTRFETLNRKLEEENKRLYQKLQHYTQLGYAIEAISKSIINL